MEQLAFAGSGIDKDLIKELLSHEVPVLSCHPQPLQAKLPNFLIQPDLHKERTKILQVLCLDLPVLLQGVS